MKQKTNTVCILALIFGIVGMFLGIIPILGWGIMVAAIVLGIVGIVQTGREGWSSNRVMALVGLVLGAVMLILVIVGTVIYVFIFMAAMQQREERIGCSISKPLFCGGVNEKAEGRFGVGVSNRESVQLEQVSVSVSVDGDEYDCEGPDVLEKFHSYNYWCDSDLSGTHEGKLIVEYHDPAKSQDRRIEGSISLDFES
ncbi:DUF4190 domain-containing protein [Candidatus Woesearchaeota archaeon]|nr:DUF4190 domain-containing protein [Candidatus Woesearchaeota archaeon]